MKVLVVADFGSSYYGESSYKSDGMIRDGLAANGHQVETFSYRELREEKGQYGMEQYLLSRVLCFGPNILIIGYGDGFQPEFLVDLKIAVAGMKIVYWYGDARPELESWVVNLAGQSDLFLTTAGGSILSEYKSRSGCPKVAFFPNLVNLSIYKPSFSKVPGNITFTGGDYGEPVRAESVRALQEAFGDDVWLAGWHNGRVIGQNYATVLSQADFGLAVSAFHDRDKMQSCRTLEYMASGICTLVKRVPRAEELLGHGTCLYFDDPKELPGLVKSNRAYSRQIAQKGVEWVEQYSHVKIAQYLVDEVLGDAIPSMYGGWVEVV